MDSYNSSENLQRSNRDVFANASTKPKDKAEQSVHDKNISVIDGYVKMHQSTVNVRSLAKKNHRTADYQLDLSADLVEILEKIKSELR